MRKILLGTTAVVGLALVAQAANAQQARPAARPAPVAAPMAPPALPATSVAPTGTAAAIYQTPVGITGAGPHGADGIPNRPETPTTSGLVVRLGGFFDFSMGNVSDSSDGAWFRNNMAPVSFSSGIANTAGVITNAKGRQRNDFRNEAEFNIYVDGVAANGMRYGAVFELQMDNTTVPAGQTSGTGLDYDELYGFMKGSWGEFRFGNEDSAASLMQVRRPSVLWMGTDDAWDEFVVNQPGGSPYIMSGVNDGNDATKLIYLSPQLMGFDAGISYAANNFEGEQIFNPSLTNQYQRDFTNLTNQVTGALRYRGTFGGVGLQTSFVAAFADAPTLTAAGQSLTNKPQNVTAYSAGLVLRAYGFAVGGEYTWGNYNGSSAGNAALAKGLDGSNHWVGSGTYTIGAVSLGAMYGKGTQDNGTASGQLGQTMGAALEDREQTYLGFGVAYILAPGMTLFANYNQVQDKNIPLNGASVNSAGTGMIAAGSAAAGTTLAKFNASGSTTRDIQVLVAGVRVAF